MKRLPCLALACAAWLAPPLASADDAAESTPKTPAPGATVTVTPGEGGETTVVAPPGSAGVSVVAPTAQGGTVTATGCAAVTVEGAPTVVQPIDGACPPFQPAAPPPKVIVVREVIVERETPRFRPDPARSPMIALSAVGHALGSLLAGANYLEAVETDYYRCLNEQWVTRTDASGYTSYQYVRNDGCRATGGLPELLLYGAVMSLTPGLPRLVVGDTGGFWKWGVAIAATIGAAKVVDVLDDDSGGNGAPAVMIGFVGAATLGIIELATTPHREDLEKKPRAVDGVGAIPLSDARGTHGALLSLRGVF